MRNNFFNKIGKGRFVLFPLMGAAFLTLISYVVMLLWNNILPDVIHVEQITLWQAAGIFILCKLLFGFGRPGGFGKDKMFRHRMAERMGNMSPEELERFKDHFGEERFSRFGKCFSNANPKPKQTESL
ncbi:hypothetical protein LPB86_10070 [Pedobacter sp. MC2016-14]|uniref:hypothetical protein n=1 Tax=Pedobacter sp. MC2016-14 TaxID=2897327 RepID=UPI001E517704|nr:hypothetical protein [Pedobacter sp. MC2016-14]MCD0488578.1 hypothetical protein [Pedobacter sp. MC2016-14]